MNIPRILSWNPNRYVEPAKPVEPDWELHIHDLRLATDAKYEQQHLTAIK